MNNHAYTIIPEIIDRYNKAEETREDFKWLLDRLQDSVERLAKIEAAIHESRKDIDSFMGSDC